MLGRQMQAFEASKGADSARQAMASFRAELEKANVVAGLAVLKLRFSSICPAH